MHQALYRTYRPKIFAEIVGQEHIKKILQNEITQKRLAHAYLFCGPRGISKTTMARVFAKTVNCLAPTKDAEPCNQCSNCRSIMNENSLDLIEIDAASNTGVDHVRERIIENSRIIPSTGKYKIFVIDEVHMLSISAFNALLKILEEPPSHVIFILATTEVHKIPATIISRCQKFDFRKIDQPSMVKRLKMITEKEKMTVEPAVFDLIARYSLGHQRDAESMLSQVLNLNKKKITLEDAFIILPRTHTSTVWSIIKNLNQPLTKNFELLEESLDQGLDPRQLTREIIEFLRQLLLIKIGKKLDQTTGLDLDQKSFQEVITYVKNGNIQHLISALELFIEAEQKIKSDPFILQLPLEIACIKYQQLYPTKTISPKESNEEEEEIIKNIKKSSEGAAKTVAKLSVATKKKSTVSLEIVQKQWNSILDELQKTNQSLTMVLKTGQLQEMRDNTLHIVFGYKFHHDFLSQTRQRAIVEKQIEQTLGEKILIQSRVDPGKRLGTRIKNQPEQPEIQNALEIFSGQIID